MPDNEQIETQNTPAEDELATGAQEAETPEEGENKGDDKSAEIMSKLQKRIGAEQAKKNDYKDKLEKALETIEKLKNGDNPEEPQPEDERDTRIKELEAQIKRESITKQARSVLTEGGMNVPDSMLELAIADDDQKTLENVKTLISYTQSVQANTRSEFRKGSTPRVNGKTVGPTDLAKALGLNNK